MPEEPYLRLITTRQLVSGGGSSSGGGSDIAKRVENLEVDIRASRLDLAEIKGRLSQMPTFWNLVTIVTSTVIAVMGATVAIIKFVAMP